MSASESFEYEPSVPVAAMYFDPNFLPGQHRVWTKKQILDFRIPGIDGKLPTFMSRYGQQHMLRPYQLTTKGLSGHFLRSGTSFRFWSPCEIALLHAQVAPLALLKPATLGWETLGNCIATPHALFAIAHAMNMLDDVGINPTNLVEQFIQERFQTNNSAIQHDQFASFVGRPAQIQVLRRRLHFFMDQLEWTADAATNLWPARAFFSPVDGILQIDWNYAVPQTIVDSPAQPAAFDEPAEIAPFYEVALHLIPGEYGTLKIHPQVTVKTLLTLWNQPLAPDRPWDSLDLQLPIAATSMPERAILLPVTSHHEFVTVLQASEPTEQPQKFPLMHRTSTDLTL